MVRASDIANVAISPKGGLWIMSTSKGLLRYKDGQITQLGITNCTPQSRDPAIVETAEGTLWIRTYGGLYRFDGSKCEKVGQETGWTGDTAQSLFLDKDETLWVKSDSGDLLFLPKGSHHFQKNAFGHGKADSVSVLRQGLDGAIWLSDENGLHRVTPGSRGAKPSKDSLLPANTVGGALFFDRDGAMWILTKAGVRVIREPETLGSPQASASEDKLFTTAGGLTSDAVWDLLQDREGTIWVATDGGLDRLTANPILQLQLPKARDAQYALLPDLDNTVWTANWDAPLMLVSDRHIEIYNQIPNSIEGIHRDRTGAVWFSGGEQDALWRRTGKRMERVKAPVSGANPATDIATDKESAVWLALLTGHVYRFVDKKWVQQDKILGLPTGVPCSLIADPEGRIWIAYLNHLLVWDAGKVTSYSSKQGLSAGFSDTLFIRGTHLWMAGKAGVGVFTDGVFHRLETKQQSTFGRVTGVLEDVAGDLWLNGAQGAFTIASEELQQWLHNPASIVSYRRFTGADGLYGTSSSNHPGPTIAQGEHGRIWFATKKGVFWTDPTRLERLKNLLPPPVSLDSITVQGRVVPPENGMRLPVNFEGLQINYKALSMADPGRVTYRYRTDGLDRDWQEAGTRREVFYTNLYPGTYTFHVIAANNDGVWNKTGASFTFSVPPKYYQTLWFKALCVGVVCLFIFLLFRLRLQRATTVVSERLAAQMAERERIARDLHDTLLQSFYGVILGFQTAADQVPLTQSSRALFEVVLQSAEAAVNEGRDKVRGLRGESDVLELRDELANIPHDYHGDSGASFTLDVSGAPRMLHPLVRDEVSRIGREAIANAYKHSAAKTITVHLTYDPHWFRLTISDDGKGIEATILDAGGLLNHWGLKGMRERSRNIGASYELRSRSGEGTCVEIKVAANLAYMPLPQSSRTWFQRSKSGPRLSSQKL
jgi:ligand-binding sensor domain-containing protein